MTAAIRPAVASRTPVIYVDVGPRCCDDCGVALNLRPELGPVETIGYIVEDRVLCGLTPKIGHRHICGVCSSDPVKERARIRRVKRTSVKADFLS